MDAQKENRGVDFKLINTQDKFAWYVYNKESLLTWCNKCDAPTYHSISGCVVCNEWEACNEEEYKARVIVALEKIYQQMWV